MIGSPAQEAAWHRHDAAYTTTMRAAALCRMLDHRATAALARYRATGSGADYAAWQAAERLYIRATDVRGDARDRQAAAYRAAYQSGPLA